MSISHLHIRVSVWHLGMCVSQPPVVSEIRSAFPALHCVNTLKMVSFLLITFYFAREHARDCLLYVDVLQRIHLHLIEQLADTWASLLVTPICLKSIASGYSVSKRMLNLPRCKTLLSA